MPQILLQGTDAVSCEDALPFPWQSDAFCCQSSDEGPCSLIQVLLDVNWFKSCSYVLQLLGFPIQLVGLLSLPYLGVRYLAEGENFQQDAKAAAVSTPCLPLLPVSQKRASAGFVLVVATIIVLIACGI